MGTAAKKLTETTEVLKVNGIRHRVPKERFELEKLISNACELQALIDATKKELDETKDKALMIALDEMGDKKTYKLQGVAGVIEINLKPDDIKADEAGGHVLDELLGETREEFFKRKVEYKATSKGRNLVADGDYTHRDKLRAVVNVKQVPPYIRVLPTPKG